MVISNNIAGLCNRIKSLLSAMRIAEFNKDSEVKVDWPFTAAVGECHFTDLFENENMIIRRPDYPPGATIYSFWRFAILPSDPLPINFSDGNGVRYNNTQRHTGHTHTDKEGRNIDLEFDRIPEEIRLEYLKQLKFNNNTVSVQIRSWNDDPIKQKLFNINDFYKLMDSMENNNFFVTADTPEIIEKMKKRYGDKIITRENYKETMGHRERGQKQGVIDAMIDLLLLSKNKTLIGTYVSTFSEMSWWFSNCKQKTYIL